MTKAEMHIAKIIDKMINSLLKENELPFKHENDKNMNRTRIGVMVSIRNYIMNKDMEEIKMYLD
ncbi:MAG: hypothetical protein PHT94_00750 [Candidatus Nanoarchaeia archaeon]|nr:hypothetical protein [Candidatus Nanoarchaeia archaeon]